jgi:hypothetical protein
LHIEIAQKSSKNARALFFDREIERVTEIAWDQTVNDPANLWQSIFWHALGQETGVAAIRDTGLGR